MEGSAEITDIFRSLHHIDKDITLSINSMNSPFTDQMWMLFSDRNIWIVLYVAVIVMLFVRLGWKKALVVILSAILCIVACDQFANLVKFGVERLRPCHDADMLARGLRVLEDPGQLYGFFSAHAANAGGFAVVSYLGFRNDGRLKYRGYGIGIGLWAFLVGVSRIFVGKHFFGDVCVGFAVGILFGCLFGLLARWVIKKYIKS